MKKDSNKRKEIKEKELHNAKEEAVCQLAEEVYFTLQSEHEGREALEIFDGYVDMICEFSVRKPEIGVGLIYTLLMDNDYKELGVYVKGFILVNEEFSRRFINHFGACSILDRLDEEDDEDEDSFDCDSYEEDPEMEEEMKFDSISCWNCKHSKGCEIYG